YGVEGLLTAVLLSGVMMALLGALRLGSLVRHMPHAVTVSFTCVIAVTIAASQLKDLLGVRLAGAEPASVFPKIAALVAASPSVNATSLALGAGVVAVIAALRAVRPAWPGMLLAVVGASLAANLLRLPVETIGARFG